MIWALECFKEAMTCRTSICASVRAAEPGLELARFGLIGVNPRAHDLIAPFYVDLLRSNDTRSGFGGANPRTDERFRRERFTVGSDKAQGLRA